MTKEKDNLYTKCYQKNEIFWDQVGNTEKFKKSSNYIENNREAADYIRCHFVRNSPLFIGISEEEIGYWCVQFAKFAEEIQHSKTESDRIVVITNFKLRAPKMNFKDREPDNQKKIFTGPGWIGSFVRSTQRRMKDGR